MKLNEMEQHWLNLNHTIIGVDEVGRGAWVNPIVFGISQIHKSNTLLPAVKDSKKLAPGTRRSLATDIKKNHPGSKTIWHDCTNGLVEGYSALDNALYEFIVQYLTNPITLFLDAGIQQYLHRTLTVVSNMYESVKGDSVYYSVAAASVIAKDFRDRMVAQVDREIHKNKYNWAGNKGYVNKDHKERVREHGLSEHHRTFFNIKM